MNTYDGNDSMDRTGRHPVSVGYLVAGLIFLGIATTWALRAADVIDDEGSRWVLPVVLIVAGVAGLTASVVRSARPRHDRDADPDTFDTAPYDDAVDVDGDQGADPLAR